MLLERALVQQLQAECTRKVLGGGREGGRGGGRERGREGGRREGGGRERGRREGEGEGGHQLMSNAQSPVYHISDEI